MTIYDQYVRLEPRQPNYDFDRGVQAEIGDPFWFLGRQWQMGEHQGEDAGSPVRVQAWVARRRLDSVGGDPRWDPTTVPPEAIIESEPGDWWTIGRRIRYGVRFKAMINLGLLSGEERARCILARPPQDSREYGTDLPSPYERFSGEAGDETWLDGWELWQRRVALGIPVASFPEIPTPEPADLWLADQLFYHANFTVADHTYTADRHPGGHVDWYTVDGDAPFPGRVLPAEPEISAFPVQLTYPGAPNSRFWQIEDAAVDLGGYPPDRSHFPSMLLTDLLSSHGTEWFLFPITTEAGSTLTVEKVVVTDGFGQKWSSEDHVELQAPTDWSLFRVRYTVGEDFTTLLVWPTALAPLTGATLEEVILGTDEYSNLLWAVERKVNSRSVRTPSRQERQERPVAPPKKAVNLSQQAYAYLPAVDAVPYWHPYQLDESGGVRRFVQARLADYSGPVAKLMQPTPASRLLKDDRIAAPPPVHAIDPSAVPVNGLALDRRWMLARDTTGEPVLWISRLRKPLQTPPARQLRFDVMEEVRE
jgi:hypothetical protein